MTTAPEDVRKYAQVESSRVRILDAPILAPGTCALCGTSRNDDRKYVDLGIDIDYIGVMYFCTFCMQEVANRIGCLMPEQADKLQNELDAARKTIIDFQAEKAVIDHVTSTLRDTGLFSGTDLSSITHTKESATPEPSPVQDIVPGKSETSRSSKSTKQSDSKQGSNDIPEFGIDDLGIKL
jgi:hypothetical protein